jgi:hypothetical protein
MEYGSSQNRMTKRLRPQAAGRWKAEANRRGTGYRMETKGDAKMQPDAISGRMDAVQAHPLAELLECPQATGSLLNGSAQGMDFKAGDTVFRQSAVCRGLYVVVSGEFLRRTERLEARLTLGPARPGDLLELAAALGDGHHTYTLSALTDGSVLMLPIESLNQAFQNYPPLRMRLLEELAREVSRAYNVCCMSRTVKTRRKSGASAQA